jgi:hypothetical protein
MAAPPTHLPKSPNLQSKVACLAWLGLACYSCYCCLSLWVPKCWISSQSIPTSSALINPLKSGGERGAHKKRGLWAQTDLLQSDEEMWRWEILEHLLWWILFLTFSTSFVAFCWLSRFPCTFVTHNSRGIQGPRLSLSFLFLFKI